MIWKFPPPPGQKYRPHPGCIHEARLQAITSVAFTRGLWRVFVKIIKMDQFFLYVNANLWYQMNFTQLTFFHVFYTRHKTITFNFYLRTDTDERNTYICISHTEFFFCKRKKKSRVSRTYSFYAKVSCQNYPYLKKMKKKKKKSLNCNAQQQR